MSKNQECRTCGLVKESNLKYKLTDKISGGENLTLKNLIEQVIGMELIDDDPKRICKTCKNQLHLIASLREDWLHHQKALCKKSSSAVQNAVVKVKVEPSFFEFGEFSDVSQASSSIHLRSKSFQTLKNIKDSFIKELAFKDVVKDLDEIFTHIDIDKQHVNEKTGEISREIIKMFKGSIIWSDYKFKCINSQCSLVIYGLVDYMKHLHFEEKLLSYKLQCPEIGCSKECRSLSSFINHSANHHIHIRFTCIFCTPSKLFYNIPCLVNHYQEVHYNLNFSLIVCFYCGTYCQSMNQLNVHKKSCLNKYGQIQNINDDDDQEMSEDDVGPAAKRSKSRDCDWQPTNDVGVKINRSKSVANIVKSDVQHMQRSLLLGNSKSMTNIIGGKSFHPKVHDITNRVLYPCTFEDCTRVLVTKEGLDYHMNVHNNQKPFPCPHCPKTFRSKTLVYLHVNKNH